MSTIIEQRSPEWFAQRKGRITASRVGAILGLSPHQTPEQVMRQMVRDYHGATNESGNNPALDWGIMNESGAIAEFTMDTGISVKPAYFTPKDDWAGASPDGYLDVGGILELKCPYSLRNKDRPEFKSIHDQMHYFAQVQFQLWCTGESTAYFYQWAPKGTKLEVVTRDEAYIEWMMPMLKAFYELFDQEVDNPEHLEDKRVEIDTPTSSKLIVEYDELSEAIENAKQRQSEIMDELVVISEGRDANICGRKLTKVVRKGSVSYSKAVKDLLPDADLSQYRGEETSYWRLS